MFFPFHLELTIWVLPLNVIKQVPLISIGSVTIDAFELFNVIVNFSVSLQCIVTGKKLATLIAGKVSQSIVNSVYVVFECSIR